MLAKFIEWIKRLFGADVNASACSIDANNDYARKYEDVSKINLTAIVANKVANVAVTDSTVQVEGDNARADFLNRATQKCADMLKPIATRVLGTGGVVLKPCILNGRLHTDVLNQSRFVILEQRGDTIASAAFVADTAVANKKDCMRLEYHTLDNGVYTVRQKAVCEGREVPLTDVPAWAELPPEVSITGVDKMLFAYVRCPIDDRKINTSPYGVPVTYGNDALMDEILEQLDVLQREIISKKAFIGADYRLFETGEDGKERLLPNTELFKKFNAMTGVDEKPFFEIFSPEIRTQQLIEAIDHRMGLLEKAIGVNKGVLTDLETREATATAIRRATFDTFSLVDALRKDIEAAFEQLVYAFDVLANANRLAPAGAYSLSFDWSYGLIEDSAETFKQYMQALGAGALRREEVRMWLLGESREEALKNLPGVDELMLPQ